MFRTVEIRWFWPARDVTTVRSWFGGGKDLKDPERRTDHYLMFPGCETCGVKVRDGRFEVKSMVADRGLFTLPAGPVGRVEEWLKWSLVSEHLAPLMPDLLATDTWLAVNKERVQRKFKVVGNSFMEVEPDILFSEAGCTAELARVETGADHAAWLTFNLEAFGPVETLESTLSTVLMDFFRRYGPPGQHLKEVNSLSYPAWLARQY